MAELNHIGAEPVQLSTFMVSNQLYGINVMSVQEVTMPLPLTSVPLAPSFVKGLINLRGQLSTAIDLCSLFNIETQNSQNKMAVVCKYDDVLVSLLIDQIGDVVEVDKRQFEKAHHSLDSGAQSYTSGVYKLEKSLLTVIDVSKIFDLINKHEFAS